MGRWGECAGQCLGERERFSGLAGVCGCVCVLVVGLRVSLCVGKFHTKNVISVKTANLF